MGIHACASTKVGRKERERDFFRWAAEVANPSKNPIPQKKPVRHREIFTSMLLDSSFQEHIGFYSANEQDEALDSDFCLLVEEDWRRLNQGCEKASAHDFHNFFIATFARPSPFIFSFEKGFAAHAAVITRAHLSWSHRLRQKSLQIGLGATAQVRYFHAHLTSAHDTSFNIVYWLQLNSEKELPEGDFIVLPGAISPLSLTSLSRVLPCLNR